MSQGDFKTSGTGLPFVLTDGGLAGIRASCTSGNNRKIELHCYVFDVAPKKIEGKKRYFQGRVWVDDHDFQIVKTYGKTVPEIRPKHGDRGKSAFRSSRPGGSRSTGCTGFRSIRGPITNCTSRWTICTCKEIVKYEDYKRFGAKSRILFEGKEIPKGTERLRRHQTIRSRSRSCKVARLQGFKVPGRVDRVSRRDSIRRFRRPRTWYISRANVCCSFWSR